MLMLERAAETVNPSECNDPAVLLACSLGSDSCPAACQKDAEETTVDENGNVVKVKSGDLQISATAAEGKKVALYGGISDLDTITLRASEAITLNSVTLERFGYSSSKDVANIWLENSNGVKIANEKSISSSKDTVTLNIKKEYRELNSEDTITIVLETVTAYDTGDKAWSSIGFKVTSVESSAKNLDISSYDPYLYDMVSYNSSKVTVTAKGKDMTYHYNNGNSYELARFQVKAGNAAVGVNGFTLTNDAVLSWTVGSGKNRVDIDKFIDDVIVTLGDGTKLSNVRFDANKDDELKVSFDEVEIAINKNIIFVVEVVLKDFDDYWKVIRFQLKETGDLNAVEKKTGARATLESKNVAMHAYLFQGGKIEVANEKIADTIDASAGSTNITVGKGKITLAGESIELNKFIITANMTGIETMKMSVNGDEYEAKYVTSPKTGFQFDRITIDENSTIEFTVDIDDNAPKRTISLGSFDKTTLSDSEWYLGKYEDARSKITSTDWAGSISLSKVRVQAAKGSLSANSTKDVEILLKQTARKVIFDGTYTATKQDVYLNWFAVMSDTWAAWDITYYLSIDGKEVGSFDHQYKGSYTTEESFIDKYEQGFSDILVKNGEKVSVKLEANVYGSDARTYANTLIIRGSDKDGNPAGLASETAAKIKVVGAGSVTVSESAVSPKEGVALNDTNITLARFTVKSSKNSEGMDLTNFKLVPTDATAPTTGLQTANVRIRVAGSELSEGTKNATDANKVDNWEFYVEDGVIVVDNLSEEIPTAGVDVEVIIKTLPSLGKYAVTLDKVNTSEPKIKFSKLIVKSIASIKSQENRWDSTTKFTFFVDKDDDNKTVSNLQLYVDSGSTYAPVGTLLSTVEDGTTLEITNANSVRFITAIVYSLDPTVTTCTTSTTNNDNCVVILKSAYRDYFKVGDAEAQIFRTK